MKENVLIFDEKFVRGYYNKFKIKSELYLNNFFIYVEILHLFVFLLSILSTE